MNTVAEAQHAENNAITFVKIENKTGATITYFTSHDFSGRLAPHSRYPPNLENGRDHLFEHMGTPGDNAGSSAAVVYSVTNNDGTVSYWMLSWSNPIVGNYKVLTKIGGQAYPKSSPNDPIWHKLDEELSNSGTTNTSEWKGCVSYMTSIRSNNVPNRVDVDATVARATARA
ncbi:hypothetical protein LOK49_LG02G01807 [Camellia lanceoleosa]|uniref:Uncharacterized protein n=1 Tax=Camellia lanceoleosa TaxID=1840588 RepID=A0ACC0ILJ4_9ERIC|nr:hypothetical protein LOK49_LG02G01807 [Camellia lanceoleosa]